jgi:prolyl oligopeptidase
LRLSLCALLLSAGLLPLGAQDLKLNYPSTPKTDHQDTYFGKTIADPYQWLENSDSEQVAAWVQAQNAVTRAYLDQLPWRQNFKARLEKLWNYPKIGAPFKAGDFYYFYKNDGLQNQSVLYRYQDDKEKAEVFLDPNTFSTDGTISLGNLSFSEDGKYCAYSLSQGGSDWNTIYVMNATNKKKLADKIEWVKFSDISWHQDGFFYSAYEAPKAGKALEQKNEFHKVYYHRLGEAQSEDVVVFENKEKPLRNFYAYVTEEGNYLIVSASEGTSGNEIYVKSLKDENADFQTLIAGFETEPTILAEHESGKLYLMTNKDAPNYKIVLIDPANPTQWETVVAETKNVLTSASVLKDRILATYLEDAHSKGIIYDLKGNKIGDLALPALGTLRGWNGKKDDKEIFYSFTSFTYPSSTYRYEVKKNTSTLYEQPKIDFNFSDYETHQVFYTSKDGTKVPMFIVHKKGLKKNGKNPTYLYAYGGFNISLTPSFNPTILPFLEAGGIYAMPNLRGGGEYGEEWHKGGMVLKKQNVFDDFIAAAEFLIKEKYTSPQKLAISGRSNGGLLVGACMTQRPDLYAVALPGVGVLDMLKFHKFTIGWAWVVEYGSSERSEAEFQNLLRYSPLHNLKKGTSYPATLVTTADHDDRVVPAHSYKFIATLQEMHQGTNPVLIRIDEKAGHGAGKPTAKVIEEWADIWAFVWENLHKK